MQEHIDIAARRARGVRRLRLRQSRSRRGWRSLRSTSGPVLRDGDLDASARPSSPARRSRRRSPTASACRPGRTTQIDVGSPFDYAHQRPPVLRAAPARPSIADSSPPAVHDELAALITAAGGRTLALFTSWKAMDAAAAAVKERVDVPILTQRDLPEDRARQGVQPTTSRRACSPPPGSSRASTSRGARCRWSPSTASRSRGPTTRC